MSLTLIEHWWSNGYCRLVTVQKNKIGKIGIFMDPKKINEHTKTQHFQFHLQKREDFQGALDGATIFSCFSTYSSFQQIPFDKQSYIYAFDTPFDGYHYLRLPFGIASTPEIFEWTMSEVFEGLTGVHVYIDNIFGVGRKQTGTLSD